MIIARTNRLILRRIKVCDAGVLLRLLNDPSYLDAIGDREVRTLEEAKDYCVTILQRFYLEHGYGLYVVECAQTESNGPQAGAVIGLCGLVKREELDAPDLGYAYLPAYWGRGYGEEAARAVMFHARRELGLAKIFGIVRARNIASIGLLEKLVFVPAGDYPEAPSEEPLLLFHYAF
ncbi:GNAT family N-acetyltransferase [uncultured Cohaesibacter sp.]|uniref:GNAT family N-acetyltransferase n=1 Tax=uncultured Cohaesibacter sp. TaxID=1002546 RepID=UPI0029C8D614|nr:GNAT family N-acetyltransferase [uncultured Cohaesibacter sp.]